MKHKANYSADLVPMLKKLQKILTIFLPLVVAGPAKLLALPIGFATHQGGLDYNEISTPNFRVFHDARVPNEAAMTVNALEAAKPVVERWLGAKRSRPLPVISSAVTDNASFANFITDAIELQTLGQGSRDLFWHEFVHASMYGHFNNWLGPAGAIVHLPWLPAWFIEGLAESLTVSVGSDVQASIERYQALTNWWPTYDRLHSLYGGSQFFVRGYSTAGGFTSWILKQGRGRNLPKMLSGFYNYTFPWYFPWALNPFSDFMPFDEALRDYNKKDGEAAYRAYQKAARKHWLKAARGPFLVADPNPRLELTRMPLVRSDGSRTYAILGDGEAKREVELVFNPKSGWLQAVKPGAFTMPEDSYSPIYYNRPGLQLAVVPKREVTTGRDRDILVSLKAHSGKKPSEVQERLFEARGTIDGLFESAGYLVWLERERDATRLCQVPKKRLRGSLPMGRSQVQCPLEVKLPKTLELLGNRLAVFPQIGLVPPSPRNEKLTTEIWLAVREQTLAGDRQRILAWDPDKLQGRSIRYDGGGTALAFAPAGESQWLLIAEHNRRSLRRISADGSCEGQFDLEDYPLRLVGLDDGSLVLGLYQGELRTLIRLDEQRLKTTPCRMARGHTSPLLWAMQQDGQASLEDALAKASLWREELPTREQQSVRNALLLASPLDQAPPPQGGKAVLASASKPASWSPRPVFAVPWIGADDALGSQFGMMSVPLMDLRQNETIRLTMLYGLVSRFPNTEMTLVSSRYWTGLSASLYRRQVWDGTWYSLPARESQALYLEEKGGRFEVSMPWYFMDSSVNLAVGLRLGMLKPYLGKLAVVHGSIAEPYLQADARHQLGRFSLSAAVRARTAPAAFNRNFNYNVLGGNVGLGFGLPFFASQLSLGLEMSRTRGESGKMPNLKEYYQPLKTFVAGSGGGYNKNSFNLYGEGRLFSSTFGDTQGRARANWTMPVIGSVDKQIWLFYFQSLNFTAFFNYGGAWFAGDDYQKSLIKAHGYNLDLLFENKGVSFNASLGSGQVIGSDFQVYFTFGFDAFL